MRTTRCVPTVLAAAVLALAACGDDEPATEATTTTDAGDAFDAELVIDVGDEPMRELDPADVVEGIDNPFMPLAPGSRWVYEGVVDGVEERVEVVVTDQHRQVMGVDAVVVRDTAYEDGEVVEDTFDWFAQDADGNVWYLGEDTRELEDGEVVGTEGSWRRA